MKISKNAKILLIASGIVVTGLFFMHLHSKKKAKANAPIVPSPSPAQDTASDDINQYYATNTPEVETPQGPLLFNNRIGIYIPKSTPEMSPKDQEIDLTV